MSLQGRNRRFLSSRSRRISLRPETGRRRQLLRYTCRDKRRVRSAYPPHGPFFCFSQHANKRQPFSKSLADFRRPIIRAWPEICHQKQFPFKAKQRHYLVKILYKWNDFFFRTITKDRNGKLDGRFDHCIRCRSSQSHDLGQLCQWGVGNWHRIAV
jgi:hypothetical protein